ACACFRVSLQVALPVLAAVLGWRGVFWLNLPLVALAAVVLHRSLPAGPPTRAPAPVPWLGGGLLTLGLALVVVGLYQREPERAVDRKSTRLNSSHVKIS